MSPFGPLHRDGPTDKFLARMAVLCAVLLIACGALAVGLIAQLNANRATAAVQGSCQFYRDLSELPVTAKSTEPLLRIVADARVAYDVADCGSSRGKLAPADPRIIPYLPKGAR